MADAPTNVIHVQLRLLDVWGGEDVIRELTLAELETSERGVAVGPAFYPWRRVVSYEWEILESSPDEGLGRPRQLLVRVLIQGPSGPEERRVAADHFEVGPWTVSMVVPDRVEPETQRAVLRRITVPWHRVLEYERMLAEAKTAAEVPGRPDLADTATLPEVEESGAPLPDGNGRVVIDVAAVEREAEEAATTAGGEDEGASGQPVGSTDDDATTEEQVAVGTGARVKGSVPRKTGQRRRKPRNR